MWSSFKSNLRENVGIAQGLRGWPKYQKWAYQHDKMFFGHHGSLPKHQHNPKTIRGYIKNISPPPSKIFPPLVFWDLRFLPRRAAKFWGIWRKLKIFPPLVFWDPRNKGGGGNIFYISPDVQNSPRPPGMPLIQGLLRIVFPLESTIWGLSQEVGKSFRHLIGVCTGSDMTDPMSRMLFD